jgi:Na+-translocating ferredoxin:NAD+ oxidoreductase RNF subunit RnfB
MTKILVTDNHGQIHEVETPICTSCKNPVYPSEPHTECIRIRREIADSSLSNSWKKLEAEAIKKFDEGRVLTKQQLEEQEYAKEQARFRQQMKMDQRKKRLSQLEAEIEHLRHLISEEEARSNGNP